MKFNLGGLILILLGLLFFGESTGFLPGNTVGMLWPLILIAVGLYLFNINNWKMNPGGAILLLLGGFFLIDTFGLLPFSVIGTYWPLILVAVGVYLLARK
ncbi:MAG: LiaI-LiaF-like domain-containing protein [Bacillota bacterium]